MIRNREGSKISALWLGYIVVKVFLISFMIVAILWHRFIVPYLSISVALLLFSFLTALSTSILNTSVMRSLISLKWCYVFKIVFLELLLVKFSLYSLDLIWAGNNLSFFIMFSWFLAFSALNNLDGSETISISATFLSIWLFTQQKFY